MKRKIITIDQEKCNGCGLCAEACQEGAIAMVNGKAALIRDDYCDGLGNCLPACPTNAITFEEREAAAFDEEAVKRRMESEKKPLPCGCPGSQAKALRHEPAPAVTDAGVNAAALPSRLNQWPVQIKLVPVNAPYFQGARLLIAADCTAFSFAGFHERFMKGRITLIGCPKLDEGDYSGKLTEILINNEIQSVTVVRMEVPCCGGIVSTVKTALQNAGKPIPWQVAVLSTDGRLLEET